MGYEYLMQQLCQSRIIVRIIKIFWNAKNVTQFKRLLKKNKRKTLPKNTAAFLLIGHH